MLNRLCLLAGLIAAATPAAAQTHVFETAQGSGTVRNVLITNTASVQLDVSTRTLRGAGSDGNARRFVIEVWNDDTTNNLFCDFDVYVSSLTTQGNYGRRVPARTSWAVAITETVKFYCVSDAAAGVRAVLTQLF